MVKQCGGTVEQCWWNSGTETGQQCRWNNEVEQCWWRSVEEQWNSVVVQWNIVHKIRKWNSEKVMVEQWHSVSGTVIVEKWKYVGIRVLLEQWNSVGGTV